MGFTRRAVLTGLVAGVGSGAQASRAAPPSAPVARRIVGTERSGSPSDRGRIELDGQERTSLVLTPPTYDPARSWPLVLFSHGHDQDAQTAIERFGWGKTCDARGYVGIFPNTGGDFTRGHDDNEYFVRLLDRAQAELAVDPRRNQCRRLLGRVSTHAYSFAANHSNRIAALAVHSGTIAYAEEAPEDWDPRRASIPPDQPDPPARRARPKSPAARRSAHAGRGGDAALRVDAGWMEAWAAALDATFVRDAPPPSGVPSRCNHYEWRTGDGHLLVGIVDPELGHELSRTAPRCSSTSSRACPRGRSETATQSSASADPVGSNHAPPRRVRATGMPMWSLVSVCVAQTVPAANRAEAPPLAEVAPGPVSMVELTASLDASRDVVLLVGPDGALSVADELIVPDGVEPWLAARVAQSPAGGS